MDGNTVSVISHFSHNAGYTYDETKAIARKYGIITAYNGLTVEF